MRMWLWALLISLTTLACADEDPLKAAENAYKLGHYASARANFEAALAQGTPAEAPYIRARLGLTLRKLVDPEAEATLRQAIADALVINDQHVAALAQRYLGRHLENQGHLDDAMALYDEALAHHTAQGPTSDLLKVQLLRAGNAWRQADFEGAYEAYQEIYGLAEATGERLLEANGLEGMGFLLSYVGQFEDARELLRQARLIYSTLGYAAQANGARANEATMFFMGGNPLAAASLARVVVENIKEGGDVSVKLQARLVLGWSNAGQAHTVEEWSKLADLGLSVREQAQAKGVRPYVQQGYLLEARARLEMGDEATFESVAGALEALEPPADLQLPLTVLRARLALKRGQTKQVITYLDQVIVGYEDLRGKFEHELSHFFTPARTWAYETRIQLAAEAGDAKTAAELVGRLKARTFTELLYRSGARRQGWRRHERGRNLLRTLRQTHRLDGVAARMQQRLPPDVGLIEYFCLSDRLLVFWYDRSATRMITIKVTREQLGKHASDLVATLRSGGAYRKDAAWLAQHLLDPVAAQLSGSKHPKRIGFIPHGELHAVPFEMLPWAGGMLIDQFAVFSVPSAASLDVWLGMPAPQPIKTALVVGDPVNNLPGARHEVQEVIQRFTGQIMVGDDAMESKVVSAMPNADLLHFAVHGIRPHSDAPAYLDLRPSSAADGRLEADEVAAIDLQARLVVLSVCNSAQGQANRGDEIVGVVDRAFLEAGARAVVASRWPVHDAASVLFMRYLYQSLKTRPLVDAFHDAQQALRRGDARPDELGRDLLAQLKTGMRVRGVTQRKARPLDDFTHPYYWAAFSLRGDFR